MFQVPSELRKSLHLSIVLAEDPSSKALKFVPVRAEIIREMKVVIYSLRLESAYNTESYNSLNAKDRPLQSTKKYSGIENGMARRSMSAHMLTEWTTVERHRQLSAPFRVRSLDRMTLLVKLISPYGFLAEYVAPLAP